MNTLTLTWQAQVRTVSNATRQQSERQAGAFIWQLVGVLEI